MTSKDKKVQGLNPRVDTSKFPRDWLQNRPLPKAEPLEMHVPMGDKLPRIKVTIVSGKDLKKDCFIGIRIGQAASVQSSVASKKTHTWNEEFILRVESGNRPFLCVVEAWQKGLGSKKTYLCGISVDLFEDLGMRFNGDQRRYNYQLDKGEVTIVFEALANVQIPLMRMPHVEGKGDTSTLANKRPAEIQFTIYQAIGISGDKPLVSQIELYHRTYDLFKLERLEACLLRTQQFKGYSPYWGERIIVPVNTKNDSVFIIMKYLLGKEEKGVGTVMELFVDELGKLAGLTESRRWYAFSDFFLGGCLGVGIQALSSMSVLGSLPDLNIPKGGPEVKKAPPPNPKKESQVITGTSSNPPQQKALTVEELRALAMAGKEPGRERLQVIPIQQAQVLIQDAKMKEQTLQDEKRQRLAELHREDIEKLCNASFSNDIQTVTTFVARPDIMEFVNMKNERGETAVFCGTVKGYVNVLLRLLLLGAVEVDTVIELYGGTALHVASEKGYFDCVCLLLAAGGNVNKLNKRGLSPRQEAKGRAIDAFQLWEADGIYGIKRSSPVTNDYLMNRKIPNASSVAQRVAQKPSSALRQSVERLNVQRAGIPNSFNAQGPTGQPSGAGSGGPTGNNQGGSQGGPPQPGEGRGLMRRPSMGMGRGQNAFSNIGNMSPNSADRASKRLSNSRGPGRVVSDIKQFPGGAGGDTSAYNSNSPTPPPKMTGTGSNPIGGKVSVGANTGGPSGPQGAVSPRQRSMEPPPLTKKMKLKNAYDSLVDVDEAENTSASGPSSFDTDVPVSSHVMALQQLLDSMRPPFELDVVNKNSWRNTLKLKAFHDLGEAEQLISTQLQRLEEVTDTPEIEFEDISDSVDWQTQLRTITEEFKIDVVKFEEQPSFDLDSSMGDDNRPAADDDFFGSDFGDLDNLLAASFKPKLQKAQTIDYNVHDSVDFDSEMPNPFEGDDNEFLEKLGLERPDADARDNTPRSATTPRSDNTPRGNQASGNLCALCDDVAQGPVKLKGRVFCTTCGQRMVNVCQVRGLSVRYE